MYVTRLLSMYKKDPSALSQPPPDGPNTGILVIEDVANTLTQRYACGTKRLSYDITSGLPFPQNSYMTAVGVETESIDFMAIPVIDKPLSAGLYYFIDLEERVGYAFTCRRCKGETQFTCCFCCECDVIDPDRDFLARPLEPSNIYQQFHIKKAGRCFKVMSAASDGLVPQRLTSIKRFYSWPFVLLKHFDLQKPVLTFHDAFGLDLSRRECLPEFNFPLSLGASDAVLVGTWYCPFMFVKENNMLRSDQMRMSMFYVMTLKQQWIRVFFCNRDDVNVRGDSVSVDLNVKTQVIDVVGMDHCGNNNVKPKEADDGITWFHGVDKEGQAVSVGLNRVITEKMNKDQESFGWVRENDKVKVVGNFQGKGEWKEFGCYMLVEKYALKTSTKKLLLTIDFWHTHRVRCKWE